MAGRHREGWSPGDHRRRVADRGLHRQPRRRLRGDHLRRAGRDDRGVPREGPHLRASADRQGRVPEPRDGRDPRAVGLHGRLPVDDRLGHVHHQRHRARGRHAARALPGRLRDGAEGPREAGLHREPDAGPRVVARARDRQEGQGLRPHRPQAQAAGLGAAARDGRRAARGRLVPETWTGTDEEILDLFDNSLYIRITIESDTEVTKSEEGVADRAVQEAAPGRAAVGRRRQEPAQPAVLRSQALRPHARRALQAQLAPAHRRAARHPHAHAAGHHRADQGADLASARPRHPRVGHVRGRRRADQGLRRRGDRHAARARSRTASTSTSTSATAACARSAS